MSARTSVLLRGGPFDGQSVEAIRGISLVFDLGDDRVARYRPSREKGVYTFRGFDTIVARIPHPTPAPEIRARLTEES